MPNSIYTLCYAKGETEPKLMLVRRQFIQQRVDGQRVQGVIPEWAGQWGLVAGRATESKSTQESAYALFLAQTGVNLGDSQTVSLYDVVSTEVKNLQDSNYNPVPVFYVECSAKGLATLVQGIQDNLQKNLPAEGVLQVAEVKRLPDAKSLVGPVSPPPDGWQNFLIQNYWGGKPPGQLNTEIDKLTATITARSAQPPTEFLLAIDNLPATGVQPPVTQAIVSYTMIANNNPYPIKIRATIANEGDWASTSNRPDKTFAGITVAPFDEVVGQADLASTASSAQVQVEMTSEGGSETVAFRYDQKAALSSLDGQLLGTFGKTPKYTVLQSTRTSDQGKPELVLVITEERGD
ncbi:MAG: hypothetical protein P8166_12185 [Candidatus Thiodiazotropha sp.]|jgi:hypothetical protein